MQTEESKESIDTGRTEAEAQKEEGKAKGRGERAAYNEANWKRIKREWCEGYSVREIARAHGISEGAVYAKASRHKWPKRTQMLSEGKALAKLPEEPKEAAPRVNQKDAKEAASMAIAMAAESQVPALQAKVRERIEAWFNVVSLNANRLQEHITDKAMGNLEVEEIKSLSSSLASLHGTMRQVFGIDTPEGSRVAAYITSAPVVSCPVIDVEAIPETTPAGVT